MARSMPSSRVRSWIDRDSVLAMPNSETMIGQRQQPVEQAQERVDLLLLLVLQALLVEHLGRRVAALEQVGHPLLDHARSRRRAGVVAYTPATRRSPNARAWAGIVTSSGLSSVRLVLEHADHAERGAPAGRAERCARSVAHLDAVVVGVAS